MRGSSERLTLAPVYLSAMFCMTKDLSECWVGRLCGGPVGAGGAQGSIDDGLVAGAAADVAGQGLADLGLARIRILLQEGGDLHQEARSAEAALEAVRVPHGLLERVHPPVDREALDRPHVRPSRLHRQHQAAA